MVTKGNKEIKVKDNYLLNGILAIQHGGSNKHYAMVNKGASMLLFQHFWLLVVTRGLVGVGEASYSTIAPTIIGDLFTGALRTWMLSLFYIFIPVGSGLGYIVGSSVADITGDWHWALRVTPILGMVGIVLLIALVPEPPRGGADLQGEALKERTSYWEDIKYLLANRSFVLSSLGVTAMAFMTGALAFWTPVFLSHAQVLQGTRKRLQGSVLLMENEREGIRMESMQGGTGSAPAAHRTRSYGSVGDDGPDEEGPPRKVQEEVKVISATRSYLAVAVLCYINLLNYMDRYTIAAFICSFMLLAPLFGYLGDRYNRKWLMVLAVFVWTAVTLGSSFVTQSKRLQGSVLLMENEREGIRIESMQGGTGSAPAARHTRSYGSVGDDGPDEEGPPRKVQEEVKVISATRSYLAVAVLCYINLLNYMDRYTIAGVLLNIQSYFNIKDGDAGLLQTVFICSFMLLAPLFGYLGDRYNRKWLMVLAVFVWTAVTLGSSFVTQSHFWLLVVTRGLVGVGEASYSTIAPTIIGDLFTGALRTWMLSLFYIFIPVGSGLGYIVGSSVADITGDWHWALRVTPILGMVGIVLLIALVPEPPRGAADFQGEALKEKTSYWEDIKYLFANRSFVLSSLGVTAMAFMTGALAFWTPVFLSHAQVLQGTRTSSVLTCSLEFCSDTNRLFKQEEFQFCSVVNRLLKQEEFQFCSVVNRLLKQEEFQFCSVVNRLFKQEEFQFCSVVNRLFKQEEFQFCSDTNRLFKQEEFQFCSVVNRLFKQEEFQFCSVVNRLFKQEEFQFCSVVNRLFKQEEFQFCSVVNRLFKQEEFQFCSVVNRLFKQEEFQFCSVVNRLFKQEEFQFCSVVNRLLKQEEFQFCSHSDVVKTKRTETKRTETETKRTKTKRTETETKTKRTETETKRTETETKHTETETETKRTETETYRDRDQTYRDQTYRDRDQTYQDQTYRDRNQDQTYRDRDQTYRDRDQTYRDRDRNQTYRDRNVPRPRPNLSRPRPDVPRPRPGPRPDVPRPRPGPRPDVPRLRPGPRPDVPRPRPGPRPDVPRPRPRTKTRRAETETRTKTRRAETETWTKTKTKTRRAETETRTKTRRAETETRTKTRRAETENKDQDPTCRDRELGPRPDVPRPRTRTKTRRAETETQTQCAETKTRTKTKTRRPETETWTKTRRAETETQTKTKT
ncbi:Protein spinster-like 3 [Acipenser ruthenus]|uniref:Protein spinster-like 3 n=1 Tax=Acipenser ruthenus TaxID=7906 RepID=A0A662YNP0_ACIRT|nr:Protein spinster-like 3 [Acipenser ruthenus]